MIKGFELGQTSNREIGIWQTHSERCNATVWAWAKAVFVPKKTPFARSPKSTSRGRGDTLGDAGFSR